MKPIRWGIVGTGSVACQFAEGLSIVPDAELYAVSSRTQDKADQFASNFNIPKAYESYKEFLKDSLIDIVYIATPNTIHYEQCLEALNSGKHVLCEKPFTMNAPEAREVCSLAKEKGLFCMEAMWMRTNPLVREVIQKVREGNIGSVRMVSASLGHAIHINDNHHIFNPNLGGGVLLDLGVYPLSLVYQLLGKPDSVQSKMVLGQTGVDEQAIATLSYFDGKLATIASSLQTNLNNECIIMGSKGSIRIHSPLYRPNQYSISFQQPFDLTQSSNLGRLSWVKQKPFLRFAINLLKTKVIPRLYSPTKTITKTLKGNGYNYEAEEAMNCIRSGKLESSLMPHSETIGVMQLLDTIRSQQ